MFPNTFSSGSRYEAPIRFGGMGKEVNANGYSDHFPIDFQIVEQD